MRNTLKNTEWNFNLFYKSLKDPQIEKDMQELESLCAAFSTTYSTDSTYLSYNLKLLQSLNEFKNIQSKVLPKSIMYLTFLTHKDGSNVAAQSLLNLHSNRFTKAANNVNFYTIALGKIHIDKQKEVLTNSDFKEFHFFLQCIFNDAKHKLTDAEEKIVNLKDQPASEMWNSGHDKALFSQTITWKGKVLPLPQAINILPDQKASDRPKLSKLIVTSLKSISLFSEAEINALLTNKKIDDELRHFDTASHDTVRRYRNNPDTILKLVDITTKNFKIAHEFYKVKAKMLKLKNLGYYDRSVPYGKITGDFSFNKSKEKLLEIFGNFDPKYSKILNSYITNGQIDVYPKQGKRGGAYCWGNYQNPTLVLLNHTDNFHSFTTFAHEMGHAFHTELSRDQGPINMDYSTSLAETASTFFENLAFEEVVKTLPKKQQIVALHNKISDDISAIFRQIACFNFEKDMHATVREKGFISREELASLLNKHMKAYLGPAFKLEEDDGYFFVQWSHIRSFFYVYTYAYGLLVSKVLLKKYRQDKNFITSIEKFLKAGGKDTPENILTEIGIDVTSGKLFEDGITEIGEDIEKLKKMLKGV